jgi:SAM-dependent methyltransferase
VSRYALDRPGNALALRERWALLLERLGQRGFRDLGQLDILEVGCGGGGELVRFLAHGADPSRIRAIDLRPDAVEAARARLPGVEIDLGNATSLPYPDESFHVVYQSTALSSMPSRQMRTRVAAEMVRVTRRGGVVVSYDFAWNPLNRDTVGIDARELRRLFPGRAIEIHRVTLAPPLGRWLGDRSARLLEIASAVALLRTHRLALVDVSPDPG